MLAQGDGRALLIDGRFVRYAGTLAASGRAAYGGDRPEGARAPRRSGGPLFAFRTQAMQVFAAAAARGRSSRLRDGVARRSDSAARPPTTALCAAAHPPGPHGAPGHHWPGALSSCAVGTAGDDES